MRSVADELREASRRAAATLSPDERVRLALRLGDEDAQTFAASRGLTPAEARLLMERRRQAGRQPSACLQRRYE